MNFSKEKLDELDVILHKTCQSALIPGMVLMVSFDGKIVFEKCYGYRDVAKHLPVTSETIFGVASITKSLTALAIMQLEDAGRLTVDDTVADWLPELRLRTKRYSKLIKIHHLLTHTAGFPGMAAINQARAESISNDPDGAYLFGKIPTPKQPVKTVTDVIKVMAETGYAMLSEPGETFNYSNESFALLQEIIERASGKTFLTYVESHILHPLQMDRSVFLTEDLNTIDNVTELYAYTKEKDKGVFHSPAWWDVEDIYTNGSWKASASDLMKYLETYRLNGCINGAQIVSEKSIRKMTTPHVTLPDGNQYGYALQIRRQSGLTFVGHSGSIKGVSSNIQIAKGQGLTVCVLTNLADIATEDIAFTAMNHLLELPDEEVLPSLQLEAEQMEKYTGHYQSAEGYELTVSLHEGCLLLDIESNSIPAKPYAVDRFVTGDGKKIVFCVDPQENVTGVFKGKRLIPKA